MPSLFARRLILSSALVSACVPPVIEELEGGSSTDGSSSAADTTTTTVGPTTVSTSTAGTNPTTGITTAVDTSVGPDPTTTTVASDTTDTSAETADTETGPLPDCPGVGRGPLALGEACGAHEECASALCTIYTDAPLNPDAVCDVPPLDCSLRVTGTSLDIVTRQPFPGQELRLVAALQAATDPVGAVALAQATSGPDGRLDAVTNGPPVSPIGLVALLEGPGFHLTATPVVAPVDDMAAYGVATRVHDLWVVSEDAVAAWSAMLALDPSIPDDALPLGASGGVVALVRDSLGVPLSGATVSSTDPGSATIVRYLNDDGSFGTTATGSYGLVMILDPALAEQFEAELDGMVIGETISVISANDAIFTVAFTDAP